MEPLKIAYSPNTQLITHSLEGVKIFEPYPESDKPIPLLSLVKDGKDFLVENSNSGTRSAFYSPSGKYIIIINDSMITIIDSYSKELVSNLISKSEFEFDCVTISPSQNFILVFELPKSKKGIATCIATLYSFPSFSEKIDQFEIEKQSKDASNDFKFRPSDDFFIWRSSKKSIKIFSLPNEKNQSIYSLLDTLQTDHMIDSFCLSKSTKVEDKFIITLSSNHIKGEEGVTQIYQFPKYIKRPKFQVPHSSANETDHILSPDGRTLLLVLNLFIDKSGKSYYGSQRLLFIQIIGGKKKCEIPLIDGQLGDVAWNPNSCDFIVISGNQPATQVLYDSDGNAKYELGRSKRNTIIYSPHGNFICIAGFGNLAGEIDFFERGLTGREKLIQGELQIKKLGETKKAHCTTTYSWDPSGKYLATGVLNPRISVQNEFKVFKYDGSLVQHEKFYETELYSTSWRPGMNGFWSEPPIKSPKPSKTYVLKTTSDTTATKSGKAEQQKKKDQNILAMFANSNFAALMQQQMGGKGLSKPRWIKGNQYDKYIKYNDFLGGTIGGGGGSSSSEQKMMEKKKEIVIPKQNWRDLKPKPPKDSGGGGGGDAVVIEKKKGETSKKNKKKQKQKNKGLEFDIPDGAPSIGQQ